MELQTLVLVHFCSKHVPGV